MLIVRDGSKTKTILEVIALTGEFPTKAVKLFGDYNAWRRRITEMTKRQEYKNPSTKEQLTCKALYITGEGNNKAIRLDKSALPLLEWVGLKDVYEKTTGKFCGARTTERNIRVAEAIMMYYLNNVPVYKLGNPAKDELPVFMTSKTNHDIVTNCFEKKEMKNSELTMFTRVVGLFLNQGTCMAVYNTRDTQMKWTKNAENKARGIYQKFARTHSKTDAVDALMFGSDYVTGYTTMTTATNMELNNKNATSFFDIYKNSYFVPLDEFGKKLLRILTLPDFRNKLLGILMPAENRRKGFGLFDYDGIVKNQYVFSFLDSNVARLYAFRMAVEIHFKENPEKYGTPKIVCYYEQEPFIRKLFAGCNCELTRVNIDMIMKKIGIQ